MIAGFVVVAILSNLPNDMAKMFGRQLYTPPDWMPVIEFPWRIAFGTVTTYAVAVLFATPEKQVAEAVAQLKRQREI
jgi:hypothetical protein